MAEDPTVTVIVATYNSGTTLAYALRSLLQQSYADFEAWIIGDACTDDSAQIVARFGDPRLHWFNLPARVGFQSGPNNEGLRRARGKYVAYLGHDDLWLPHHLTALVSVIETENADFVHSVAALIAPDGICGVTGTPGVERSYASRFIPPSSWMHRRDVVDNCGAWPLDRVESGNAVDLAFQRRLFLAGKRFAGCPQLTVVKFPSARWRLYARPTDPPQRGYWAKLEQDPRSLQESLFREIAYTYGRQYENVFVMPSLLRARQAFYLAVREWYGADRWPLKQILNWRVRRTIRSYDQQRGLPTSAPDLRTSSARSESGRERE